MKNFNNTFGIKINRNKSEVKYYIIAFAVFCLLSLNHCVVSPESEDTGFNETVTAKKAYTWSEIAVDSTLKLENSNYYTPSENLISYSLELSYFDFETESLVTEYLDTVFYKRSGDLIVIDYSKLQYDFEDYAKIISLQLTMEFEKKQLQ